MEKKEDLKKINELTKTRKLLLANAIFNQPIDIQGNTYWEELTCVGFNPQLEQLEAVVSVKRATGYSGNLCSNGSTEYVRFFVDWHDGNGFQDVGLTSFKAYDISDAPPGLQHPLKYMVFLGLEDNKHQKPCNQPVLPTVRAVLGWNEIPSLDPNDVPHFGNRLDADIQIEPRLPALIELIDKGLINKKIDVLSNIDLGAELTPAKLQPVGLEALKEAYRKAKVPDHRLAYQTISAAIKGGVNIAAIASQPDIAQIAKLKLNLSKLIETLDSSSADTTYEELVCAGLNTDTDTLGAVIHIKEKYGYSGELCQTGSKEFVAFWADWENNGSYDNYLGTASVEVHDIQRTEDGLYYSVMLPVNFSEHLRKCADPNIIRIRAVLSWATPPSTTDPNELEHWGNRLDVSVQLRPFEGIVDGPVPLFYTVGSVPISNISTVTFLAHPSGGALNPDNCIGPIEPPMDRPFGGRVKVRGRIYNTGAPETVYYQVQYNIGDGWFGVTDRHTFVLMHPDEPDPLDQEEIRAEFRADRWFPYLEDLTATPPILERSASLAWWDTGSLNGPCQIRLAFTKDYPITPASVIETSEAVTIVLDNTDFRVNPGTGAEVNREYSVDLVIDGGDCHSYEKGDTFTGHLRVIDKHFWKWRLDLEPTSHTHNTQAVPRCKSYGSLVDQGYEDEPWEVDTTELDPCGYTLTVHAYDRTIIDSKGAALHSRAHKAVGFSVRS